MTLHQVDIEKSYLGEFWTNRYIINVDSLTAGVVVGQSIVNIERQVHAQFVTFTKYRVSDVNPDTDAFVIVPLSVNGLRAHESAPMPFFNVVRVDFPAGTGRPSRKYLRGVLQQSDCSGSALKTGVVSFVNENYGLPLGDLPGFVDPQGTELGTGQCAPNVAMRQLRRGSKRKTKPILP